MPKISTLLDHIDNGHMALPEFQRGYVWKGTQVRALFNSLYHRYPVGGLIVWATQSEEADYRGNQPLTAGVVKLLLDGQQRITSLYGVIRGKPPTFFEGDAKAFTDLYFNLNDEIFEFYQPAKMKEDPLWIDVTDTMRKGYDALAGLNDEIKQHTGKIARLLGIVDIDIYTEELTGDDKSIDIVVDIFDRVNSRGTTLSKGDLALAKICASWPAARSTMNAKVKKWADHGFTFDLDWLLRSVNTILTGEAQFRFLHSKKSADIQVALNQAEKHIDACLNYISGRLGLDHDRVLFGRNAFPVMVRYLNERGSSMSDAERDKLLFWFVQAGMWGRFSGSTETTIDSDLEAIASGHDSLDKLIEQLRVQHGNLQVIPDNFSGFELGARFYPILYMLTRMSEAKDWGNGLPLKNNMLGNMNKLEVHHIFPKSQLREHGISSRREVNALANFCFLTKDTNLQISNRLPEKYFVEIEKAHPGVLASQWIPLDPELWKIANYHRFLDARRKLLARETNRIMRTLLGSDSHWLDTQVLLEWEKDNEDIIGFDLYENDEHVGGAERDRDTGEWHAGERMVEYIEQRNPGVSRELAGRKFASAHDLLSILPTSVQVSYEPEPPTANDAAEDDENEELMTLNEWVKERGFHPGIIDYEYSDPNTGEQLGVFDLAWPTGLQEELSQPVVVLIDEDDSTIKAAAMAGFRCFTGTMQFQSYVSHELLRESPENATV